MRLRRWLEFIKDYVFPVKCILGKGNVMANVLSRKVSNPAAIDGKWFLLKLFKD